MLSIFIIKPLYVFSGILNVILSIQIENTENTYRFFHKKNIRKQVQMMPLKAYQKLTYF